LSQNSLSANIKRVFMGEFAMSDVTNRKYAMTPLAAGVVAALNPSGAALAQ
jgi:hypothetical protein